MAKQEYVSFRDQVYQSLRNLAKANDIYEDAQMILASSEAHATLIKSEIMKSIDPTWVKEIEKVLPSLDTIIRKPNIIIEDVDEVLPVELSRHINDKSIKHLAQHTNLIMDVKGDDVTPQKILNVYHDETYKTYENKFVNTLLVRLSAFVEKRYKALAFGSGTERNYKFNYTTEFEHHDVDDGGRNKAQITLSIELTSPFNSNNSESSKKINTNYRNLCKRITKIHETLLAYLNSDFAQKVGHNYVRPPVIRTNAILKNKDLKECLNLWEFIESFDKVGYSVNQTDSSEMPGDEYIQDLYQSVALQYVNFYEGVNKGKNHRILSKKHLFDQDINFNKDLNDEDSDDYKVYDSEYKKMVPVSRVMAARKKLSEEDKRIIEAVQVACKADDKIRKLAEERRKAEEAARLAELERIRLEEERKAQEEAARLAEEERIAREEEEKLAQLKIIEFEKLNLEKIKSLFAPEDGIYEGRHPICAYTRKEFYELGAKTRKIVKIRMSVVCEYRNLQVQIAQIKQTTNDQEAISKLEAKCNKIAKKLPKEENWEQVLECHRHFK